MAICCCPCSNRSATRANGHRRPKSSRPPRAAAILLTHDGYGHLSFQDPSACVEKAETEYLVQLVVPSPGTVCASNRQPFDPEFGKPLP